jgi:hypothetical protein
LGVLYCEVLREAGLLLVVFSCLDATFGAATIPLWGLPLSTSIGVVLTLVGIHFDPEV